MKPVLVTTMLFLSGTAAASERPATMPTAGLCLEGIEMSHGTTDVPTRLLAAVALVESRHPGPTVSGAVPWPWTIDVGGKSTFFSTKDEAVAAVRTLQDAGVRSIDVGCMQINLLFHPDAFGSIEQAFDPRSNVRYGALFLSTLFRRLGSWDKAVAAYHSQTAVIGAAYQTQVMALLVDQPRRRIAKPPSIDADDETPEFRHLQQQAQDDEVRLASIYGKIETEED